MCILRFTTGYTAYVISIYLPLQTGGTYVSTESRIEPQVALSAACFPRVLVVI